jgi:uncharacterized protein DUF4340
MSNKISNKTLGGIFAVLILIFLFLFVWNGDKNERSFREELVTIDSAGVTEIVIYPKAKQHGEVKLFKEDEGWKVRLNENLTASVADDKIAGLLTQLTSIKPERLAARGKDKFAGFQVDSTGTRVKVYEDGDETLDIIFGRFNFQQQPQQQGMPNFGRQQPKMSTYVRLGNDTDVYEVDGFLETYFNQEPNAFRNGSVIKSDQQKWNQLTFSYPADTSFQLIKMNNEWFANDEKTDSAKTINILRQLASIRSSAFIDDVDPEKLGASDYKLTIETEDGEIIDINAFFKQGKYIIHSSQNSESYFDGNNAKLGEKIFVGMSKVMPDK